MAQPATQGKPNFSSLLDRAPSEVERPKPLPAGSYVTLIEGLPRYDKSTKKQTDYVEFTHRFLSSGEDVEATELDAALTSIDGTKKPLNEVRMKNTFYLTENSLWRLKDFLQHLGFDIESDEYSLRDLVESTAGKQCGVFVKHVPSQDGTGIFAQIDRTFPLE